MGRYNYSKQQRNRSRINKQRPVIDGRSGTKLDSQYWLYHEATPESSLEIQEAAEVIEGAGISRMLGSYTLSLLHPAEINMAIQRSSLRGFVTADAMYERISLDVQELEGKPLEVGVRGLHDFGHKSPKIGIDIDSPELVETHGVLMSNIYGYLGVKRYREMRPHISIARGALGDMSNRRAVEASLPAAIDLGPLKLSKRQIKRT